MSEASGSERRLTKNEKRRLKKKNGPKTAEVALKKVETVHIDEGEDDLNVVVEYVSADLQSLVEEDPTMAQFKEIFEKFSSTEELAVSDSNKEEEEERAAKEAEKQKAVAEESSNAVKPLSKKKKKLLSRLSVAELKQLVQRPDVVEAHDVTAADPRLLVHLKAYRNTVPVPRHWCHKRKYLQGKRGMEKPPFQLPGECFMFYDI